MKTNRGARILTASFVTASVLALIMVGSAAVEAQRGPARPRPAAAKRPVAHGLPCGSMVAFQVLLDRQGFSPGEVTGAAGVNTARALTAFQQARHVATTGRADCATWRALNGEAAEAAVVDYLITAEDSNGPFTAHIPARLDQQADLPALSYRSVLERLAERFHSAPALLTSMNRGARFTSGERIKVPNVTAFDSEAKPDKDATAGEVTILVSRADSSLRAARADGTVVFFAPVTSGSAHDPLPVGDWKITGVAWHPVFHYNPDLFWDASPTDQKATIKAGPNNPVGLVWIDLNLEHYGLHGTPEPGSIGVAQSHGCVRLTNWDVARVAALVKPGTPVQFR